MRDEHGSDWRHRELLRSSSESGGAEVCGVFSVELFVRRGVFSTEESFRQMQFQERITSDAATES